MLPRAGWMIAMSSELCLESLEPRQLLAAHPLLDVAPGVFTIAPPSVGVTVKEADEFMGETDELEPADLLDDGDDSDYLLSLGWFDDGSYADLGWSDEYIDDAAFKPAAEEPKPNATAAGTRHDRPRAPRNDRVETNKPVAAIEAPDDSNMAAAVAAAHGAGRRIAILPEERRKPEGRWMGANAIQSPITDPADVAQSYVQTGEGVDYLFVTAL